MKSVGWVLCGVLGLVLLCAALPAHAAMVCQATVTDVDFGDVSAVRIDSADAAGLVTVNCSGGPAGATVLSCLALSGGTGGLSGTSRLLLNGTTSLRYNFYADPAHTQIWGNATTLRSYPPPLMVLQLDNSGSGSVSTPIYASLQMVNSAIDGLYASSFAGGATALRAEVQSETYTNCASLKTATQTAFMVSATVIKDCMLYAEDLDFGTASLLDSGDGPLDATSSINITCTNGIHFAVSIDAGSSAGGTLAQRLLTNVATGSTLEYQIYTTPAHTTVWGNGLDGTTAFSGMGTGEEQAYIAYGEVPTQAAPEAGVYTDTLVVTVVY